MASAKKLPSGNWRVSLYIGKGADGKRLYKSFTAPTKKEAEFLAAQYNQKKIDVTRGNITLKEAAEEYIKIKTNVLSPSTIKGYRTIVNSAVPELMATKLSDITPDNVQAAFNTFAKDHKPKTCRNVHGFITAVLAQKGITLALRTTLPQRKKYDIYVPDENEVLAVSELVAGSEIEIPFLLATQCGLRASEISGLDVSHVYKDHIEIRQARVIGDGGEYLKDPKSYAGNRSVPISEELYNKLLEQAKDNRVCPISSMNITKKWTRFKNKNSLNSSMNFHALRHHFASKCLLLGMPQKYTAELMGHSSLDMIEKVYQHTFPSAMEQYAEMLRKKNSDFMQHNMQHDSPKNRGNK